MAAQQTGKWAVIRNLRAVIRDSFLFGWEPKLEVPNDEPAWGDNKA